MQWIMEGVLWVPWNVHGPPVAPVWYLAQRDRQSGTPPLCCDGALSPEGEYNWLSLLSNKSDTIELKKQRN